MQDRKKQRLLITDMDGTLLNRESQVSPENMEAIKGYLDGGGWFTLATGRPPKALQMFTELLELVSVPAILFNGGLIRDLHTGTVLYERFMPDGIEPLFSEVLDRWPGSGLVAVQGEDGFYQFRSNPELVELGEREQQNYVMSSLTEPHAPWNKLIFTGDHGMLKEMEAYLFEHLEGRGRTVFSEPQFLEVLPWGVSKGSALKVLMDLLELDPSNVVAMGDGMNDLEMLERAGIGVAVANAAPALHTMADHVVCANYDHAVRESIERFLT